jgi:two-component system nitrogen regulation response regulator GlnG
MRIAVLMASILLAAGCYEQLKPGRCEKDSDCAAGLFCSQEMTAGVFHRCIAIDAGPGGDGGDASSSGCTQDRDCPVSTPVCGTGGTCVGCTTGATNVCATLHPTRPICAPAGACVECAANPDCPTATKPACDPVANVCVVCTSDDQCAGRAGPVTRPLSVSNDQLRHGIVIVLGGAIVVCLHTIRLPILRGPNLGLVGGGDAIEAVRRQITNVAGLEVPVLILGETGSGKELVARAINAGSPRVSAPFVAVNMAAVPSTTAADELFGHEKGAFTGAAQARPGYFAEADGGTLFLDEIAATPPDVQMMLLRVLETGEMRPLGSRRGRKVDVRVLAATDEDLEVAVRAGRFAEPLLQRLSGYQIRLPPLRERRDDIGLLLVHFLRKELGTVGEPERLDPRDPSERPWLSAEVVARIASSRLSGNVRELRNFARQVVISSRGQRFAEIDATVQGMLVALDAETGSSGERRLPSRPTKVSDEDIQAALRQHNYNFSAAAQALGIHRSTLYDRVRENPDVRSASDLSDPEVLDAHERHEGDVVAMAAQLRVSPKPLKARLTKLLSRRGRKT